MKITQISFSEISRMGMNMAPHLYVSPAYKEFGKLNNKELEKKAIELIKGASKYMKKEIVSLPKSMSDTHEKANAYKINPSRAFSSGVWNKIQEAIDGKLSLPLVGEEKNIIYIGICGLLSSWETNISFIKEAKEKKEAILDQLSELDYFISVYNQKKGKKDV